MFVLRVMLKIECECLCVSEYAVNVLFSSFYSFPSHAMKLHICDIVWFHFTLMGALVTLWI